MDGDLASLGKFRCGNWFELVAAGNEREDDGRNGGFSRFLGDNVTLAGEQCDAGAENRAGDFGIDDIATIVGRVRHFENIVCHVIPVDALVRAEPGCGFLVVGGKHGRIGLRFCDHDGLCQDGKTGASGG